MLEKHYDDAEVIYSRGEIIHFDLHLPYVAFSARFAGVFLSKAKFLHQNDTFKKTSCHCHPAFQHEHLALCCVSIATASSVVFSLRRRGSPAFRSFSAVHHRRAGKMHPIPAAVAGWGASIPGWQTYRIPNRGSLPWCRRTIPSFRNVTDFEIWGSMFLYELKGFADHDPILPGQLKAPVNMTG